MDARKNCQLAAAWNSCFFSQSPCLPRSEVSSVRYRAEIVTAGSNAMDSLKTAKILDAFFITYL